MRLATALCALFYLVVFVKAGTFLPEFIFRDADKIQAQMTGASTYDGTSFDAVAGIYGWFGPTLLNVLIAVTGVLFIHTMLSRANRLGLFAAAWVLCVPCVFFNLFVASKDTLVVLMSLLIVWAARRQRAWFAPVVAASLYIGYALLVRRYFLLIVALACGIALFRRASTRWKIVLAIASMGTIFVLPDVVYFALLHPRDMAVDYLTYQSPFGARTSFYNPLEPTSFVAFCVDYLYASARLNLALLFSPGLKELAMQLFVGLAVLPALRGAPRRLGVAQRVARETCACLLLAHIGVSMLFEPDLGSYIRHLSSVTLFAMVLLHGGYADDALRRSSARGCLS
ncbi:MAG TPA: hypothetical protein VGL08_05220 [Paraburkholderia sp.]